MILNLDTRVYLIKFQYSSTNGKFIFQDANDLMKILKSKENDPRGIEYIKELDYSKNTFKKLDINQFLMFAKWETEAIEFLKTHYYFKKYLK